MCFGWGAVDLGGDFSSVVKMQKIGVTIKIRNSCMNNSVEALILFKVASRVQKIEVFKKDWNFASCSSFASCIMKKHFFQGGEEAVLCCIASGKSSVNRFSLREFRYFVFDVIAWTHWKHIGSLKISKSKHQLSGWRSFSGREEYEFAFRFWCSESSVKKQLRERQEA